MWLSSLWSNAGLLRLRPGLVLAPWFRPGRGGGSAEFFNSTNSLEKLGAAVAFASSGKGVGVEGVENVADKDFVVSGFQPEAGGGCSHPRFKPGRGGGLAQLCKFE